MKNIISSLLTIATGLTLLAAPAARAQLDYSTAPCGVAWHGNSGLMLGATWTAEAGPGPDINDGVAPSVLTRGAAAYFDVTVNGPAIAQIWIDMNGNNNFEPAERVIVNAPLGFAGTHRLNFTVPAAPAPGAHYVRVRVSNTLNLGPVGGANTGEVSDFSFWVN